MNIQMHNEIKEQFDNLRPQLIEDSAGDNPVSDKMYELLKIYGQEFNCSPAMAYSLITKET